MITKFVLLAVLSCFAVTGWGQKRIISGYTSERGENAFPPVMGKYSNADWKSTGIKYISLQDSVNAPLRTSADGQEFFPYIISLALDKKIDVLEYDMSDDGLHMGVPVDIKKVLADNALKYYETDGKTRTLNVLSLSADIDAFYVIDGLYFDSAQNRFRNSVYAICPVLIKYNEFNEETKYPLFWILGEDIEPYINTWFTNPSKNEMEYVPLSTWLAMGLYCEHNAGDVSKEKKQ